jgi:hypothetical protein
MVTKLGKYVLFYRHFLYGSALLVSTILHTYIMSTVSWLHIILSITAGLLIGSSFVVTYTVNKYPEEFKNDLSDL